MPIAGFDRIDFEGMARSAGYAHACRFDKLEELLIGMEEIMRRPGPVLVAVKVIPEVEPSPFPERSMANGWAEVRDSLGSKSSEVS